MEKVAPLEEAVSLVRDGSRIALTGFAITRNNIAVAHALVRARRRDLTLVQVIGGMETDLLAAGGCLRRLEYSGGSLDRFGQLFGVNRAIAEGGLEVAEFSSLALTLRLHAGGLGLPFVPTRSMLGSDLLDPLIADGAVKMLEDPFRGGPVVLLEPLRADIAFVHADVADERGNATIDGPTWSIRETAFAADTVVIVCEELVPVGAIDPNRVTIPGAIVTTVAEVRRAAHPTAVYGRYDYDRIHLDSYAAAGRKSRDAHDAYLERYIHGVEDHDEYLALAGSPV